MTGLYIQNPALVPSLVVCDILQKRMLGKPFQIMENCEYQEAQANDGNKSDKFFRW